MDVSAEARMVMFDRHNGGADLMRVNFEQIGADVIAAGLITRRKSMPTWRRWNAKSSPFRRRSCGA